MNEIEYLLLSVEKNQQYSSVATLKNSPMGKVEKVTTARDDFYIRKEFYQNTSLGKKEYQLLQKLQHPFLPKVFDGYSLENTWVFIEEYICAPSLFEEVEKNGPFSVKEALVIIQNLCSVIHYLHQRPAPILHRDIKPDNILYLGLGNIKLIDFGAAREYKPLKNRDTTYVGTIGYAPPEQFGFGQTNRRSDIYGIGMTLYFLLTGKTAQRGNRNFLETDLIPSPLQKIIGKATAFDPLLRYENTMALSDDLKKISVTIKEPFLSNIPLHKNNSAAFEKTKHSSKTSFYPTYRPWPKKIKVAFFPIHFLLFALFVNSIIIDFSLFKSFGVKEGFLHLLITFTGFGFLLFPTYLLSFNLFNVLRKIPFLKEYPLGKSFLIIIVLFIIGGIILSSLEHLHSPAYLNFKNSATSISFFLPFTV